MKIQNKLFVTSLFFSLLLIGTMLLLTRWSLDKGMLSYTNSKRAESMLAVSQELAAQYAEEGSWQRFKSSSPRVFHDIFRQHAGEFSLPLELTTGHRRRRDEHRWQADIVDDRLPADNLPVHGGGFSESRFPRADRSFVPLHRRLLPKFPNDIFLLFDAKERLIVGKLNPVYRYLSIPITVDGEQVGQLRYKQMDEIVDGYELAFLEQQQQAVFLIALLLLIFTTLFSLPLARHLVNPLRRLAEQTKHLAQGNYSEQTDIKRNDEIGTLSRDINILRKNLQKNETMRQRWVADTSHELRTPVALLLAQLEAMQDGIRPQNALSLEAMHKEITRLSTLIDDLQQLSLSDLGSLQYKMQKLDLTELLEGVITKHQQKFTEKGLQLLSDIAPNVWIKGDATRLQQLFDNLLNNSLKYTDRGGMVRVVLRREEKEIRTTIIDSAPGVTDEQLEHLFDYLYRTEQSRNRATGGSGLGLSICQHIANAHKATINASHAKEGGLEISVCMRSI